MTGLPATLNDLERREVAADWVLRLRSPNLAEAEASAWLEWCEADPKNRAAFEAMAELWELSGGLDASLSDSSHESANDDAREPFRRTLALAAAIALIVVAAAALLLIPGLVFTTGGSQIARLQTPLGQVQSTTLEDGSRIELGGRTSLAVRYSPAARTIVAEGGEAFFQVAHNSSRPFRVEAGPVTVTAIGTAFSVQRDGDAIAVAVTEGAVEIRVARSSGGPMLLRATAGQRVQVDRGDIIQSAQSAEAQMDIVGPWRAGRLEFREEPLRLVVARINRYSPRQLEITDPSIADLRITTTVYRDRVDAWLQGLSHVLPVRVTSTAPDRATISPAG